MIYLAGVVGSINALLCFAFWSCALGIPITAAMASYNRGDAFYGDKKEKFERADKLNAMWKPFLKAAIIVGLVGAVTPSEKTIYAIAASEYGEEVLKTPEATKARQALNAWLDEQIKKQDAK
jgi:hypothetical protein